MLHSDELMMVFMQFMERQKRAVLIHFWLLAANFVDTFSSAPQQQVKEDAMGIYNRFFSLQAPDPLGVDEHTRTRVEENICMEDGIGRGCFDDALHLVYTALRLHYFPLFKEAEEFATYLAGLDSARASCC